MISRQEIKQPLKWLRLDAAVKYSGLARSTLYNLIQTGQLKSSLVLVKGSHKGMRLIPVEAIDKLIASVGKQGGL